MSFGSLANINECATSMAIGKEQIQNIYGKRKKEEKKHISQKRYAVWVQKV